MGFVEAIQAGFNNYANFSGRATRPEYWWWFVFTWIVSAVSQALDRWAKIGSIESPSFSGVFVGVITGIVALALIIPSWAVLVRRLHDTNRSGWWWLLVLIPIIGWIILIVFLASPGTPGPNRYGASPYGPIGQGAAAGW
jgi:uncharacterized membrane protein YhaH (DUF805 family)